MEAPFSDPYFYDNEIDRMLAEMRAQRRQQKRMNKRQGGCPDNRRQTRGVVPADLFTSLLERQQSMEATERRARPLPKTSFLAVAEGGDSLPRDDDSAPAAPQVREERVETGKAATADVPNDESSVEVLRRELRIARKENALLRREMYATLTTIGRYLAQFAGNDNGRLGLDADGGVAENTAGSSDRGSPHPPLPPATSAWELCERGLLRLSPEEAELVRNLNEVIESSLKRYVGLEEQFARQGPLVPQPEIGQWRDEAAAGAAQER